MVDHEVAEFAARLPTELKLNGRTLKYLLRKVAERHLPDAITEAPKQGFMFPIARWLKEDLRDASRDLLVNSRLVEEEFFERSALETLLDEHQSGRVDHHHRLWMLINVEIWFRHYVDAESTDSIADYLRHEVKKNRVSVSR